MSGPEAGQGLRDKPTKYRILHVIDHLGSGGAQEAVCQLVKYSQAERFQPEVVVLHGFGHYWEVLRSWGVPVRTLVPQGFARAAIPVIFLRLFLLLARNRYDIVHTHLIGANVLAAPLAALYRVPVRFTHDQTHDDVRGYSFVHRWLDTLANRLNHHVIAVSSSIRTFLCRQENVSADKISVIYNSVDLLRFSPKSDPGAKQEARHKWGLPAEALIVGGVGRLHYQKNFPLFLQVAAEVCARLPQALFVIAGEGPERAALEEMSRRLGLASRVRFLGFVKEMPELYQALDLLVLTSHFEGTPLTVLEAMAMGVPVVASQVDGVEEVLENGRDGILVPPGNKDLFVKEICRVLQGRSLRQRLSQAGQEKARRQFSAEAMVRQVESLYLKYLENGSASDEKNYLPPLANPA
jgi:glycosyltransferase involved in cell wall biosynthesis